MKSDRRVAAREELDDAMRDFLARGGKIVQCAPGASENVVLRRDTFRRGGRPGPRQPDQTATPTPAPETKPDPET